MRSHYLGLGPAYSGLYRQVVFAQRCVCITEVVHRPAYSSLCRQVVFVQRCIVSLKWSMYELAAVSIVGWSLSTGGF